MLFQEQSTRDVSSHTMRHVRLASGTQVLRASCVWWAAASHSPSKDLQALPRPALGKPYIQFCVRRCK